VAEIWNVIRHFTAWGESWRTFNYYSGSRNIYTDYWN